jgi:hypothetical protein
MNSRFFAGACILAGGLMVKLGAPLPTVAAGIAVAALLEWKRQAIARLLTREKR